MSDLGNGMDEHGVGLGVGLEGLNAYSVWLRLANRYPDIYKPCLPTSPERFNRISEDMRATSLTPGDAAGVAAALGAPGPTRWQKRPLAPQATCVRARTPAGGARTQAGPEACGCHVISWPRGRATG